MKQYSELKIKMKNDIPCDYLKKSMYSNINIRPTRIQGKSKALVLIKKDKSGDLQRRYYSHDLCAYGFKIYEK